MFPAVYTQPFEGVDVEFNHVVRRRLEDYLELIVVAHPVGVVSVTGILGPPARFNICHVPGLRAEHIEEGQGVHGPGAFFNVVRLPDVAAVLCPKILQCPYHVLKIETLAHGKTPSPRIRYLAVSETSGTVLSTLGSSPGFHHPLACSVTVHFHLKAVLFQLSKCSA